MPQVFRQGELNLAALKNNDVYVLVQTPANTSIQGVDTGIVGLVGTGSWGPLNTPKRMASNSDVRRTFGAQKNATNDLPTDANIVFNLRVPTVIGVRVSDGTDVKASAALQTAAKGTVTVAGTFSTASAITVTFAGVATVYQVVAGDTNINGIAASLCNALNQNMAFRAVGYALVNGAVVTLVALTASNATTLTSTVAGGTVTATASGGTLAGGGTGIGTFNALYSGEDGNNISYTFSPGYNTTGAAPTWNLTLSLNSAVPVSELFTNLPEGAGFAAALSTALQSGQGVTRAPSVLARFTAAGGGTTAPVGTQTTFASGTNGDAALTSSQQLGTNQAIPPTGMYALKNQGVQKFGLCGNTDTTTWATQLAWAKQVGALVVLCFPANTATATAIATKASVGIVDYQAAVCKDWIQFLDTVNSLNRLVSPLPFALGRISSLTPEQSPGNKPIDLIIATERTLADQPYSSDELGLLADAGILVITNPCPGGAYFGLRSGINSVGSTNKAINGIEYSNMTNFLAYSLAGGFGEFIDQNQTQSPNDPVRLAAQQKLMKFMQGLLNSGYIEDFSIDMSYGDGKVNTAQSVQDGFMIAVARVKYKSVIRFFVVTLVGGKTVDVSVK